MHYAKGIEETPCLAGRPKSLVLEVLKLPAGERESFVEENGDKSVRQIRKLIEERDEARRQEELAKKAYERIESGYNKAADMLQSIKNERDYFQRKAEALESAPPEQIEVEVVPEDYEDAKREAAEASDRLAEQLEENERLAQRVRDAEAYAEEQEELRKQAQSELRRIRDGAEEQFEQASPCFQPLRSLVLSNPLWPTWGHSLTCRHSSAQWIARKLKPFKNGLKSSKSGRSKAKKPFKLAFPSSTSTRRFDKEGLP